MSFDLVGNLMLGHAWGQLKAPPSIDLTNKTVQAALPRYVWQVAGLICLWDLSVDRIEMTPEGLKAYPNTDQVHPSAALPTYIFKAFPPGYYRALECYSEGKCPRCEKHVLTGKLAVCTVCAFEMSDIPPDGSVYVPTPEEVAYHDR